MDIDNLRSKYEVTLSLTIYHSYHMRDAIISLVFLLRHMQRRIWYCKFVNRAM